MSPRFMKVRECCEHLASVDSDEVGIDADQVWKESSTHEGSK